MSNNDTWLEFAILLGIKQCSSTILFRCIDLKLMISDFIKEANIVSILSKIANCDFNNNEDPKKLFQWASLKNMGLFENVVSD